MKKYLALCAVSLLAASTAHAWGRHDFITRIALSSNELSYLHEMRVSPESIEKAAPDLMARVIPGIEQWCLRYHREHDTRYAWTVPAARPGATAREALLWALEDNVKTPLTIPPEEETREPSAAEILVRFADEPDGLLDGGLDRAPYLDRLRASMSVFLGNDAHTHAFRHYYVPSSLLPPILEPRGIAPYRAALYARLAQGAFKTGHPYWGFRFLAWSIHYVQDVTQPWHTIFLPGISFLSFSKAKMKKEVSALHYLTEAFGDSWMLETTLGPGRVATGPQRGPASPDAGPAMDNGSWAIAGLTEELGRTAHSKALKLADLARSFFQPIVDRLGENLRPETPFIPFGGIRFAASMLDFSGNGSGATRFLAPIWSKGFKLGATRDQLGRAVASQLGQAEDGSRLVIARVLNTPDTTDTPPTILPITPRS